MKSLHDTLAEHVRAWRRTGLGGFSAYEGGKVVPRGMPKRRVIELVVDGVPARLVRLVRVKIQPGKGKEAVEWLRAVGYRGPKTRPKGGDELGAKLAFLRSRERRGEPIPGELFEVKVLWDVSLGPT